MALRFNSGRKNSARSRRRGHRAAAALVAAAAGLSLTATALGVSPAHAAATLTIYGTLDTQTGTAATEDKAGVTMAMFELDWASFEPQNGQVSSSYLATMKSELAAYKAARQQVTLGLGMEDPPSWVLRLASSRYVDQNGATTSDANLIFSQAVRNAAATYLSLVFKNMPPGNFWALRLNAGDGDGEMLYPGDGTYFAFDHAALTGSGLAAGMTPNPDPHWKPGTSGLTSAQIDKWLNWYIGGLDNVTNWQMKTMSGLGFRGYYETVTPGSGSRPDDIAYAEAHNLPNDGTTGVGAVWDRYYSMLPNKTNVIAYVSSVGDQSGNDDSCQASDTSLSLASSSMDSWSATRWIARVAHAHGLPVAGENVGYGLPASLEKHYTDKSSKGMMADSLRQAHTCGFKVFYWAHDVHLWDGLMSLSLYTTMIRHNS